MTISADPAPKKTCRRVSILRKGLLVLAIPLLYQAVFIGVLLKRQHDLNNAQFWAMHTKDVMARTDHIFLQLVTQHSNLRGFVISGNPVFEGEIENVEKPLRAELDKLRTLIRDNPTQQERLDRIAAIAQSQLDFETRLVGQVKSNDRGKAIEEIKRLNGKDLMDQLRTAIEQFRHDEEKLDEERLETLRKSGVEQTWLLLGGMGVNLGVGALAAAMFSREISDRIMAVADNTRRIESGESLAPLVSGSDEIRELDEKFHAMADNLKGARFKERVYQQTLEGRASELTRANNDLSHKNAEIEMFVYSVSHDLRSPLVNLQGFSKELGYAREELLKLATGDFPEEQREAARLLIEKDISESVRFIQSAVTRLSGIIDALLRLSRAGSVEYRPEMVALAPVVGRIVEAMRGSITSRGAQVAIGELQSVWADPTAIEQIFANLIGNAVNYLDPQRPGQIEVGMVPHQAEGVEHLLTFYVKDNGLGIAEAYLPKVFAIFQRLHGTVAPGEGVGLALVRRMIERHGGKVWVESTQGVGSTFFLSVPATRAFSPLAGIAPRKETISFRASN